MLILISPLSILLSSLNTYKSMDWVGECLSVKYLVYELLSHLKLPGTTAAHRMAG